MELSIISYSSLFLFLTILLILFLCTKLVSKLTSQHHASLHLPPGPRQLPIIGSLLHLLGSEPPHHRFRELSRKFGPLIHLKLGEISTLVASSPETAREIMKTHDIAFANRSLYDSINISSYNGKGISMAPYGDYWRQLRKICMLELLSIKRANSFRSIREEEVSKVIMSISSASSLSGSTVNLSEKITALTNNITARAMFGDRCKEQGDYLEALYEQLEIMGGFNLADLFPTISGVINIVTGLRAKIKKSHRKTDRVLDNILKQHRERRSLAKTQGNESELLSVKEVEDLVDTLLRFQEDRTLQFELTDESIKALLGDLFAAGTESSSSIILWAMSELLNSPKVMKMVQSEVREAFKGQTSISEENMHNADLNYLHHVVIETLRLHPPLPLLLPRECQKTCELLGYKIPEKTRVLVNVWAIGRDPKCWAEDAEEFRPERFEGKEVDFKGANFELLPFGSGRRMCPGIMAGITNVEFPLAEMLYYFDWEIPISAEGGKLDMTEALGLTSRRKSVLWLKAISRNIPRSMA